jgi:hypothetical protein
VLADIPPGASTLSVSAEIFGPLRIALLTDASSLRLIANLIINLLGVTAPFDTFDLPLSANLILNPLFPLISQMSIHFALGMGLPSLTHEIMHETLLLVRRYKDRLDSMDVMMDMVMDGHVGCDNVGFRRTDCFVDDRWLDCSVDCGVMFMTFGVASRL